MKKCDEQISEIQIVKQQKEKNGSWFKRWQRQRQRGEKKNFGALSDGIM